MAKVGKKSEQYDPFASGAGAFGALNDALGALDAPVSPVGEGTPEVAAESERAAAVEPVQEAAPAPAPAPAPVQRRPAVAQPPAPVSPPVQQQRPLRTSDAATKGSQKKKPKRFLVTSEESSEFESAAMRLGAALGVRIDFSKLTRALWEVYLRHEDDILKNVPSDTEWERPSNQDSVGLAELEEHVAELLNAGLGVAMRRPANARRER